MSQQQPTITGTSSKEDVEAWTKSLKFSENVVKAFVEQEVDGETLLGLTRERLISPPYSLTDGAATKVISAIKKLKPQQPQPAQQDLAPILQNLTNQINLLNQNQTSLLDQITALNEKLQEVQKYENLSLSKVNDNDWKNIETRYGLAFSAANVNIVRKTSKAINNFVWTNDSETDQIGDCSDYLGDLIGDLPISLHIHNISGKKQFLANHLPKDVSFKGTADIALSTSNSSDENQIKGSMMFVVELNKDINGHQNQANSELLAANYGRATPVIHILTNLGDQWVFRWLAKPNTITTQSCDSSLQAFLFIWMVVEPTPLANKVTRRAMFLEEKNPFVVDLKKPVLLEKIINDVADLDDLHDILDENENRTLMVERMIQADRLNHFQGMYS